jgi:hypothetical protein
MKHALQQRLDRLKAAGPRQPIVATLRSLAANAMARGKHRVQRGEESDKAGAP